MAKAEGMSPHERMLYHRKHSLAEMNRLKNMCREKLESKLVEPNAPLWEPLTFIINQWDRLTKFCEVPGVPLDTQRGRADAHHPGPVSGRFLQLQDAERG